MAVFYDGGSSLPRAPYSSNYLLPQTSWLYYQNVNGITAHNITHGVFLSCPLSDPDMYNVLNHLYEDQTCLLITSGLFIQYSLLRVVYFNVVLFNSLPKFNCVT